jgi:hypothetical protein
MSGSTWGDRAVSLERLANQDDTLNKKLIAANQGDEECAD